MLYVQMVLIMVMHGLDEVFCPHCGTCVANKTYRMHKRLYYDDQGDQWVKKKAMTTDEESKY